LFLGLFRVQIFILVLVLLGLLVKLFLGLFLGLLRCALIGGQLDIVVVVKLLLQRNRQCA
jgi:hypothetical protein